MISARENNYWEPSLMPRSKKYIWNDNEPLVYTDTFPDWAVQHTKLITSEHKITSVHIITSEHIILLDFDFNFNEWAYFNECA